VAAVPWSESALRVALLGAAGAASFGALVVHGWGAALAPALGLGYWALLAALVLSCVLALAALRGRLRPGPASSRAAPHLRSALALPILTAAALVALFPTLREPYVAAGFGLAGGVLGGSVLIAARLSASGRSSLAFLEPLALSMAFSLLGAELGLRLVAAVWQPQLLADRSQVGPWIDAMRLEPGAVRFGFPVNSRGYYDREPPAPGKGPLVVVIGDSFGVGTVAWTLHYTSIAERDLPGVEFYNMGVAGADPSHYLALLREEALPLRPDLVVVALFIGNDLEFEVAAPESVGLARSFVDRRQSLVVRFVERSVKLAVEGRRSGGDSPAGRVVGEDQAQPVDPERPDETFPWFADPRLESPTFSVAGFKKLEVERALAVTAGAGDYACFPWLLELRAAAGEVPLLVLLVPDEFQVEDDVWADVVSSTTVPLDRDRPQREVERFCREHGISTLDLLPALRAVPPMGDGRRHLYLLRDTHWNARGNEVAGRELARAVAPLLGR